MKNCIWGFRIMYEIYALKTPLLIDKTGVYMHMFFSFSVLNIYFVYIVCFKQRKENITIFYLKIVISFRKKCDVFFYLKIVISFCSLNHNRWRSGAVIRASEFGPRGPWFEPLSVHISLWP